MSITNHVSKVNQNWGWVCPAPKLLVGGERTKPNDHVNNSQSHREDNETRMWSVVETSLNPKTRITKATKANRMQQTKIQQHPSRCSKRRRGPSSGKWKIGEPPLVRGVAAASCKMLALNVQHKLNTMLGRKRTPRDGPPISQPLMWNPRAKFPKCVASHDNRVRSVTAELAGLHRNTLIEWNSGWHSNGC